MKQFDMYLRWTLAVGALAFVVGCSKPQGEEAVSRPEPAPVKEAKTPAPMPMPAPAEPQPPRPMPAPVTEIPQPGELAQRVFRLESQYQATADFSKRVEILYNLSMVETPEAADALSRMFLTETDKDLKIELVNALMDVEGETDRKLTLLTAAIQPGQPKEVREEAIDLFIDLEDPRGIQILQGLLADPDPEIREAAQDSIEMLQDFLAAP